MRAVRGVLGVLGVAAVLWGGWLVSDDGFDRLLSTATWLVGVVVLHDVILVPVVVLLGLMAAKVLPRHHRSVAAVAFLVWGTFTLAVANVLSGRGGKPGMDSLLHRPYVTAWLVLTGLVVMGAAVVATVRVRRPRAHARHP